MGEWHCRLCRMSLWRQSAAVPVAEAFSVCGSLARRAGRGTACIIEAFARVAAAWMGDSTVVDGVHGPLWLRSVPSGLDVHVLGGVMRRDCAAARGSVSKASGTVRRWTPRGSKRFRRLAARCVWPLRIRSDARRSWAQAVFCGASLSSVRGPRVG